MGEAHPVHRRTTTRQRHHVEGMMVHLKTLDELLLEWWDFVDADPADPDAFEFVLPDGRIVKKRAVLRPHPPRRKKYKPAKNPHWTVIVHHKHRDIVPD